MGDIQPVDEQPEEQQPAELQPMTPGGKWLSEGGGGLPHYIVNLDHIARLLSAGYKEINDPRELAEGAPYEPVEPEAATVVPVALVALPDTVLPPGIMLAPAQEQPPEVAPDTGAKAKAKGQNA